MELDLPAWFMPYVNAQRPGQTCDSDTAFCGESGVIQAGDVIHTDVGICYLRLCTDTQEMGYVPKLGEAEIPKGLIDALKVGNRWQDLLTNEFVTGRTGNEITAATRAECARTTSNAACIRTRSVFRPCAWPDDRYVGRSGRYAGARRLAVAPEHVLCD